MRQRVFFVLLTLFLLLGAEAQGATFHTWVDKSGVTHYANDPTAIPAAYRADAQQLVLGPLKDHSRYTAMGIVATTEDRQARLVRLQARIQHLSEQRTQAAKLRRDEPLPDLSWSRRPLGFVRSPGQRLAVGSGRIVQVKERRTVDGINSEVYVMYGPNGEELSVSPRPSDPGRWVSKTKQ